MRLVDGRSRNHSDNGGERSGEWKNEVMEVEGVEVWRSSNTEVVVSEVNEIKDGESARK